MITRWIVRVPQAQRAALARCRLIPGLEAAEETDWLWVRGPELTPPQERMLLAIPRAEWFHVDADGELQASGQRLTSGTLPPLVWTRVAALTPVLLPTASFAGTPLHPAALELARTTETRTPNLLVVRAAEWLRYGETAPQVRLARWTFAADASGRVLVRGLPLPPLPGESFVEEDGIALPAGWTLAPSIPSGVLRDILRIAPGDIALFAPDGTWEHVTERDFVSASRAALRNLVAGEVRP